MKSAYSNWPASYKTLAAAMYRLRERTPGLHVVGLCLVHPRHFIPVEHTQLLELIASENPPVLPGWIQLFRKLTICFLSALYDAALITLLKLRFHRLLRLRAVTILFKTWAPNETVIQSDRDFYFATLGTILDEQHIAHAFLFGNGASDDGSLSQKLRRAAQEWNLCLQAERHPKRYIPELLFVGILTPLRAVFNQWKLALRLRRDAMTLLGVDRILACQAASDALRPFTTKNFYQRDIAREAVRWGKPKAFITLYEGRPWERLSFFGAREADPAVRLIGYQHTVVMAHAFSLLDPHYDGLRFLAPDQILCTGETTHALLAPGHASYGTHLSIFGASRRASQTQVVGKPKPELKTVLVLPEGILSECVTLFMLAAEISAVLPDHRFIFRCHPVLPFENVAPSLSFRVEDRPGMEISRDPLIANDFDRASALLYRGSSSVLYALLHGVKPIYYHRDDMHDVDPLFQLNSFKEIVTSAQDAADLLHRYAKEPVENVIDVWRDAASYADAYNRPMSRETVSLLVDSLSAASQEIPS